MKKLFPRLLFLLILSELLLVLISWLLSATQTEGVRTLLSSEGVRWLLGQFTVFLLKPQLIWLLLLSMAFGCLWQSCLFRPSQTSFRRQFALRLSAVVFVVQTASIALLIATPQAVLLSATGTLWPSPFSRALVPLAAIITINTSICYGLLSRTFTSVADIYESQKWGLSKAAPLMILYLIVVTLYESFRFVFI
jgi:aminobenzoyl-glutamate transport protein